MYQSKMMKRIDYLQAKLLCEGLVMCEEHELNCLLKHAENREKARKENIRIRKKHSRFFFTEEEKKMFLKAKGTSIDRYIDVHGQYEWITRKNENGFNIKENKTYLEIEHILAVLRKVI